MFASFSLALVLFIVYMMQRVWLWSPKRKGKGMLAWELLLLLLALALVLVEQIETQVSDLLGWIANSLNDQTRFVGCRMYFWIKVEWDSLSWKQSWFFACFCVAYVSDVKIRNTVVRDRYVVVDTSIVGRWYHNRSRSSWMILTISFIHHELWRTNTQHTIPAFQLSFRSKWHTWVYYSPELFAFCINPPQN